MLTFDNIILTGRPASGKSELIDFLKNVPVVERIEKFHIGEFDELDDFLWVWEMGENDDIWEKMGRKRLHTENIGHGYEFHEPEMVYTKYMTLKMNRHVMENFISAPKYYENKTLFVEFARGGEDCYKWTLNHFDESILKRTAVFFLGNSFEECIRRNNARYEEKKKHSILAHKTPDKDMNGIYRTNDWGTLTNNAPHGLLEVKGVKVPYVTVVNEPELTDPQKIEERFAPPLRKLWELYKT